VARAGALPDRRNYAPGQPTFEELLAERDRMFEANPKTRFIARTSATTATT
jgi:hypothetical protein